MSRPHRITLDLSGPRPQWKAADIGVFRPQSITVNTRGQREREQERHRDNIERERESKRERERECEGEINRESERLGERER